MAGILGDNAIGEIFHTGLRKGLDSLTSALAWQLAHSLPPKVWGDFLTHLETGLNERGRITPAVMRKICLAWDDRFVDNINFAEKFETKEERHQAQLWHIALELMTHDDWFGMAAWFVFGLRNDDDDDDDEAEDDLIEGWKIEFLEYIANDRCVNPSWELRSDDNVLLATLEGQRQRAPDKNWVMKWSVVIE